MRFDWHEYLNLAHALVAPGQPAATEEARRRAAVSRAYYAAYCSVRNRLFLETRTPIPLGQDSHKYVWDAFKNSPEAERKKIGASGDRLKKARIKADYWDEARILPADVSVSLSESEQVFVTLAKL